MYFLLTSLLVRLNNFSFVYWYFFWEKPEKSCLEIRHLSLLQLDKINKTISVCLFALFRFGNSVKYFDSNIHISLKHQQFLPNLLYTVFVFCLSVLGLIRFPCRKNIYISMQDPLLFSFYVVMISASPVDSVFTAF